MANIFPWWWFCIDYKQSPFSLQTILESFWFYLPRNKETEFWPWWELNPWPRNGPSAALPLSYMAKKEKSDCFPDVYFLVFCWTRIIQSRETTHGCYVQLVTFSWLRQFCNLFSNCSYTYWYMYSCDLCKKLFIITKNSFGGCFMTPLFTFSNEHNQKNKTKQNKKLILTDINALKNFQIILVMQLLQTCTASKSTNLEKEMLKYQQTIV